MRRSLRRTEAAARARTVGDVSYTIVLDVSKAESASTFASRTTARFHAEPGSTTFLDVEPAQLHSVTLNGEPVDIATAFDAATGRLRVSGVAEQNEVVVDAVMGYSHDGEGLHKHLDPADGNTYLCATSALTAGPRWFACFDQPDIKASITLSLTCPPHWTAIANGAATTDGSGRWRFAPTRPFSTYLATLVAGPYHSVHGEHDGIRLGVHVRASLRHELDRDADELLSLTADCLDEFHRLFGVRYPWGEYHQAFVPEFNWGAMENPGCVTFRDNLIFRTRATTAELASRAATIAHEMAHMWFGNLVTFAWWDDLWLNESFAEYLGHRVIDAVTGFDTWVDFGVVRKAWGYAADRRPSTHPVAGNGTDDVATALNDFDGISYAKGASVLRQLATWLRDSVFLDGLRNYFAAHAYGNARFADLLTSWTAAGAHGLEEWARHWLTTTGLDSLVVGRLPTGVVLRRHSGVAEPDAGRPHSVTVAAYGNTGHQLAEVAVHVDGPATPLSGLPSDASLLLPDAHDQTWAKIVLADDEWQALHRFVAELPTAARVNVCNALRLAVADAELGPSPALDVVTAVLTGEPDEAIISAVGHWCTETLVGVYLAPGERRRLAAARLARAAEDLLRASAPGSARQLVAARLFIAATSESSVLRSWLDGRVPDGIELEAELRWTLLGRLVANGDAPPDEIAAESTRDNSAQGAIHAARLRALLPSAEAKEAAWNLLMHDAGASNYELYATAQGFWHPAQTVLTAPFVPRYFTEIASTAGLRSGLVVRRLALFAFPWTAVEPATITASEELLARPELDERIRRSVVDATDDLRRALTSRTRFSN